MKKNINILLLLCGSIFLIFIGWHTFFYDGGMNNLKKQLEETTRELEFARDTILSVKTSLKFLQRDLEEFKLKSDILAAQRDSMLLAFHRKNAADWDEAMKIEKEQKALKDKLLILRQTDNKLQW